MTDPSSFVAIKDIISSFGVIVAIFVSIVSLIKSARQKHVEQIDNIEEKIDGIEEKLNEHILDDEHAITELQTNVKNLTDNVNTKLDVIIRELDK